MSVLKNPESMKVVLVGACFRKGKEKALEGAFDKYCIMHIDVEIELKIDQFCVLRFASYVGAWQRGRGSRASCN